MIIILIAVILLGIIVVVTNRKRRKSVMIRNLRYRQMDEPVGMIDYSRYHEGLGGDE